MLIFAYGGILVCADGGCFGGHDVLAGGVSCLLISGVNRNWSWWMMDGEIRVDCLPKKSKIRFAGPGEPSKLCTSFLHREGVLLTLDSFYRGSARSDGLDDRCKDCKRYAIALRKSEDVPVYAPEPAAPSDGKLRRRAWSRDYKKRMKDIREALLVSIIENEGDLAMVSDCLNVPIHQILEIMDGDEELVAKRELGRRIKAVRTEGALYGLSERGNQQAVKMILNNLNPDEWGDRQQVDIRRVGFTPPEKEAEDVSILQLVKGDDNGS